MRCFVCLFACLCSGVAAAAGLPEAVLPQGVGVNIHFTRGHERDLDMIAAAGFKFIRMDFSWSATERSIGQYDFSAYDELTDGLAERGIRPLYILDYSNALYEATITAVDPISGSARRSVRSPQRPESVAAFARWAGAAAAHFRDRGVVWEIWNEPNIGFWKPEPNVDQYIALARATCGEIRQNDPHATIVAPASSAFPWEFFERLFASGILEQIDAVSVHPYRGSPPETATADYLRLRALIARCAPPERRSLPILSGEWGYSTNTDGIPLARQAEYLARQQLINLLCDVRLSIWYDWVNDGPDPHEREHNFGTVANDRTPKPSYVAVQTLTRELAGYRIARRLRLRSDADFVLLCVDAQDRQKLVGWTTDTPRRVTLDVGALDGINAVALDGAVSHAAHLRDGKLRIDLTGAPCYVALDAPSSVLAAEAAWHVAPTAVPVVAGGEPGTMALHVRNPFQQTMRATFKMVGDVTGEEPLRVELPASQSKTLKLGVRVDRRDAGVSAAIEYDIARADDAGGWHRLCTGRHDVPLLLVNPLRLTVAPTGQGVRVQVDNPSGEPLQATVRLDAASQPVAIPRGVRRAVVDLAVAHPFDRPLRAQLLDEQGRVMCATPTTTFRPIDVSAYRAVLDGDSKVEASASIEPVNVDASGAPWSTAYCLKYDFRAGWRFVRCAPQTERQTKLPGMPTALGVWVFGDGSGNTLRARVRDATGQTLQPGGAKIAWRGWRWIEMPLDDPGRVGHWGGADDGRRHPPLTLDCPVLLDGHRRPTAGEIRFAGATIIERAEVQP